jgi:hypothetical protein
MSIDFVFDGSKIGFYGIGVFYGCYVFLQHDGYVTNEPRDSARDGKVAQKASFCNKAKRSSIGISDWYIYLCST